MTDIQNQFNDKRRMLLDLLDSPVIDVQHIGSTALGDEGIMDILVIVPSLHAMTTLDEKRLNQAGFYRLHHPYHKKCVFSEFHDLISLQENAGCTSWKIKALKLFITRLLRICLPSLKRWLQSSGPIKQVSGTCKRRIMNQPKQTGSGCVSQISIKIAIMIIKIVRKGERHD